jgi:hypothetical protein
LDVGARRFTLVVAAVVSVLCALVPSGCGKSARKEVVLGRKSATGRQAAAEASASIPVAEGVRVRVAARPRQQVTGSWTISCSAGRSAGARAADHFGGQTPLTVTTRDVVFTPAKSCTVIADARLSTSGLLSVEITH